MNVYYELSDVIVGPEGEGKYFAAYDVRKSAAIAGPYMLLMQNSERAWAEEGDTVRFLKHRWADAAATPVDMREFFWIKLKSQAV